MIRSGPGALVLRYLDLPHPISCIKYMNPPRPTSLGPVCPFLIGLFGDRSLKLLFFKQKLTYHYYKKVFFWGKPIYRAKRNFVMQNLGIQNLHRLEVLGQRSRSKRVAQWRWKVCHAKDLCDKNWLTRWFIAIKFKGRRSLVATTFRSNFHAKVEAKKHLRYKRLCMAKVVVGKIPQRNLSYFF